MKLAFDASSVMRALRLMCVLTGLAAAAGCDSGDRLARSYCDGAGGSFPSDTLEDWKSYADHLAVIEVLRRDPEGDGIPVAHLRVVEVLWSHSNAPTLPDRIAMRPGWPYEVGDRFLSPLMKDEPEFQSRWSPLAACDPLPVRGRTVAPDDSRGTSPVVDVLRGKTLDETTSLFNSQQMDPIAQRYEHLRPRKRVQAVLEAGGFR